MNMTTLIAAKKNLGVLIKQVENDAEPTLIFVDENHKAVLISERKYNSWQETVYPLSNPANAEHLRKSLAEAESGLVSKRSWLKNETDFYRFSLGRLSLVFRYSSRACVIAASSGYLRFFTAPIFAHYFCQSKPFCRTTKSN